MLASVSMQLNRQCNECINGLKAIRPSLDAGQLLLCPYLFCPYLNELNRPYEGRWKSTIS
jgi:hypothetical protein